MSETKPDLMAELAEVVRLSERDSVYPGPWHWSANGNIVTDTPLTGCDPEIAAVYSERNDDAAPDNAKLIIAAVNFLRTHHAELEAVVRDDRQRLPDGWRIEVRESDMRPGTFGLLVFGPQGIGAFAIDGETEHKSEIRAAVIAELGQAMHNSAREG